MTIPYPVLMRRMRRALQKVAPLAWPIALRSVGVGVLPAGWIGEHRITPHVRFGQRGGRHVGWKHIVTVVRPPRWSSHVDRVGIAELLEHEWTHAVMVEREHARVDALPWQDRGDAMEQECAKDPHGDEFWLERGRIYRGVMTLPR